MPRKISDNFLSQLDQQSARDIRDIEKRVVTELRSVLEDFIENDFDGFKEALQSNLQQYAQQQQRAAVRSLERGVVDALNSGPNGSLNFSAAFGAAGVLGAFMVGANFLNGDSGERRVTDRHKFQTSRSQTAADTMTSLDKGKRNL